MNIDQVLSDERTSQATIGLPKFVFEQLIPCFEKGLKQSIPKNKYKGGRPDKFKTSREKLFFL